MVGHPPSHLIDRPPLQVLLPHPLVVVGHPPSHLIHRLPHPLVVVGEDLTTVHPIGSVLKAKLSPRQSQVFCKVRVKR